MEERKKEGRKKLLGKRRGRLALAKRERHNVIREGRKKKERKKEKNSHC